MAIDPDQILAILDRCCDNFTFPMLDNGYYYLAATRLSLYRSTADWAMVIETFGFSPRAGIPHTSICTFASALCNRDVPESYGKGELYENYLKNNPNNEVRFINPLDWDEWQKIPILEEAIGEGAKNYVLRGRRESFPSLDEYTQRGIPLEGPPRVQIFEFCRMLADIARNSVLATEQERRLSVLPEMSQIFQLEEWHHPNVVDENDRPSGSETFQQLAKVLATGNVALYQPTLPPNTHWLNWPAGGSL
jgi:hypothetical protein